MPKWGPAADRGLWALSDPQLSNPKPRWERSAAMVEEELGVNIAVCTRLQLISHSPTNITLSKIKCKGLYFYKEVYSFVHWSRHYRLMIFPRVSVYLYIHAVVLWLWYTTHTHTKWNNVDGQRTNYHNTTYHRLNCFNYLIDAPGTNMKQNIA